MTFITRLSTEDCVARLAAAIDTGWWNYIWGSRDIVGKMDNPFFQLRMRNPWMRSITLIFYGTFISSNNTTLIRGEFRIHPLVKIFMIGWFSMLGVFEIAGLFPTKGESFKNTATTLLFPLGMMAFGAAMISISLWLGRYQKRKIVAFIKDKLEASDAAIETAVLQQYALNQPWAFETKRVLIIFAWTVGVYYGSNMIITGILSGITFSFCRHRHLDIHSYLAAHLSLVDLIGVVISVFCVLLAALALVLGLCGRLPGTKNASAVPPLL